MTFELTNVSFYQSLETMEENTLTGEESQEGVLESTAADFSLVPFSRGRVPPLNHCYLLIWFNRFSFFHNKIVLFHCF